jgi:hypothetical protein
VSEVRRRIGAIVILSLQSIAGRGGPLGSTDDWRGGAVRACAEGRADSGRSEPAAATDHPATQKGANQLIGFHVQELTWAMMQREYAVVTFEPLPVARSGDVVHQYGPNPFFEHAMMAFSGVLCGRTSRGTEHAIAWSAIDSRPTDPRTATKIGEINVIIRTFYAVIPKSNQPLNSEKFS